MTFHSLIAYARYNWQAKGRHGTHSPFVYDFVEHVLQNKEIISREHIVPCPDIPLKYENLISRIASYYNYDKVLRAGEQATENIDMLLVNGAGPESWMPMLQGYLLYLKDEGAMIITGIHNTVAHSVAWKAATADEHVRMAMDVYGLGVLLFRKEFKEKQVFVLKY